jgi:hypothetical protein
MERIKWLAGPLMGIELSSRYKRLHIAPLACLTIIPKTVDSHLVLVVVEYSSASTPYRASQLSAAAQRQFLPGPGEGPPIQSVSLQFEGVVRIDGGILR